MEKRVQIGLKLPPDLIKLIDEARATFEFPPDRTAFIERAIIEALHRHGPQLFAKDGKLFVPDRKRKGK